MRPTRRGVGVVSVALAATLVGTQYGQRGLAAIAAPLFVALVGAAMQVRRTGAPAIERSSARRGFVGSGSAVTLSVDGGGIARLTDARPEALGGPVTVRTGLPATVEFDVPYDRRGDHRLGPVEVTLTDALGLVVATTTVDATDAVLLYPAVYRLDDEAFMRTLDPAADDRQTFDRLREYAPGDPMRDIHWKSSAKRDDLLVAEFDDRGDDPGISIAARATDGNADAMATAAGTVALAALRYGFTVELSTPGATVTRASGERQRIRILEALARTPAGESDRAGDADVVVSATDDGVTVATEGRNASLDELLDGETPITEARA